MKRASSTFSVLQATAAIAGLAIILWSVGLPSLRIADAANVTDFSDTLSDTDVSAVANHTIEFVSPAGVASGEAIIVTFDEAGTAFDLTGIGQEDVDLFVNGSNVPFGTDWAVTVNTTNDTITLTSQGAGGTIAGGATTSILVGLHADTDGTPDTQIVNPASAGSYEIDVDVAGGTDTGSTRVAILDSVTVTATVDTSFTFIVGGVGAAETVNGTTTGGVTTATDVPFGVLEANTASTAAQDLSVVTNATNGFTVSVVADSQLVSATGADIDGFANGNFTSTPTAWTSPSNTVGSEETYGHWGLTSDDTDYFASEQYVSASTTPVEVFTHNGPVDGTVTGQGTTRVGYTVEIGALQEAADDYTATLTYVATPVF